MFEEIYTGGGWTWAVQGLIWSICSEQFAGTTEKSPSPSEENGGRSTKSRLNTSRTAKNATADIEKGL